MSWREKIKLHLRYGGIIYLAYLAMWWLSLFGRVTYTHKYDLLWWVGVIFSASLTVALGRRIQQTSEFISTHYPSPDPVEAK